jgi:single-stranded DNA-binding protein
MISALVSGILFRTESRVSKNGKSYVTASLRTGKGDDVRWVTVLGFSELAQSELRGLRPGDYLSVQGLLRVDLYSANSSEQRISITIVADAVLPLRRERKPVTDRKPVNARKGERQAERDKRRAGKWLSEDDGPNDGLDFGFVGCQAP